MIAVALKQTGSKAVVISTDRLFQGTDAETIFVLSPFTYGNPIQISATLPDGTNLGYNPCEPMPSVADHLPPIPMSPGDLPADYLENISVWKYDPPTTWANKAGRLDINFAVLGKKEKVVYTHNEGQRPTVTRQAVDCYLTTQMCELTIEEAALPVLDNGDDNVAEIAYEDVLRYLSDIYTSVDTIESDLNDEGGIKDRLNAAECNIEAIEGVLDAADSAPTQGSNDLVKSGGTYTAIKDAKDESIAYTNEKFAQITGGVDVVTGVKGSAESSYRTGDVSLDKDDIGLGNVDNTSDLDKPVSTAQQTAIDGKVSKKPDGTNDLINDNNKVNNVYLPDFLLGQVLYGGTFEASTATATLSTNAKSKLGTSDNTIVLTDDTTAVTGYVANEGIYYIATDVGTFAGLSIVTGDWLISNGSAWAKIDNTDAVQSVAGKTGAVVLDKSDVGLGNVDNTSDMDKPVSTAQQTALNAKQNTLTFDSTPTAGSNNPVTSDGIYTAILTGGSGLSVDSVPTQNSNNLVKSGGVYDATFKKVYTSISQISASLTSTSTIKEVYAAMETRSILVTHDFFTGTTVPSFLPASLKIANDKIWTHYALTVVKQDGLSSGPRSNNYIHLDVTYSANASQTVPPYSYVVSLYPRSFYYTCDTWVEVPSWSTIHEKLSGNLVSVFNSLPDKATAIYALSSSSEATTVGLPVGTPSGEITVTRFSSECGEAIYRCSFGMYINVAYYDSGNSTIAWKGWQKLGVQTYRHNITISDVGVEIHFAFTDHNNTFSINDMESLLTAINSQQNRLFGVSGIYLSNIVYAANFTSVGSDYALEIRYSGGTANILGSSTYSVVDTIAQIQE